MTFHALPSAARSRPSPLREKVASACEPDEGSARTDDDFEKGQRDDGVRRRGPLIRRLRRHLLPVGEGSLAVIYSRHSEQMVAAT